MRSVAISTKIFINQSKEIDEWLRENEAVTSSSIIHPCSNYYNHSPNVIITFEDPELAMLFKLSWG